MVRIKIRTSIRTGLISRWMLGQGLHEIRVRVGFGVEFGGF